MNADEIHKLEAGPGLDALIAEHVMGWKRWEVLQKHREKINNLTDQVAHLEKTQWLVEDQGEDLDTEQPFTWRPWATYKPEKNIDLATSMPTEPLPIDAPPCVHCKWFQPHRVYVDITDSRADDIMLQYNGVDLCTTPDKQYLDFSCYRVG